MQMNKFHYALLLALLLYGITMLEDAFEETALIAWELIGNKRYRLYKYTACVSCDNNNSVELPCNADIIESVTTSFEDWNNVSNIYPNGDINSSYVEEYIESNKSFSNPLYTSGKFVKYTRVGDTLYFDKPYGQINILYKGVILDEDGLPELTDKEALAIATYCAYVVKFKEGIITNNANIIQLATALKAQWSVQCDLARVASYLNLNEMDLILDAKSNWNRKIYGKSFKSLR